jgi:hypothetical protein
LVVAAAGCDGTSASEPPALHLFGTLPDTIPALSAVYALRVVGPSGDHAVWSVSDTSVLTLAVEGADQARVIARREGTAQLEVRWPGASPATLTRTVVVRQRPARAVIVPAPDGISLQAGAGAEVRLLVSDSLGTEIARVSAVTWTSSDSAVLRVSAGATQATLLARRAGTAVLTANADVGGTRVGTSVTVRVAAPPPATFVGRTWEVIAVGGQPLPRAVSVLGRGTCFEGTLSRSRVTFLADGTFEHQLWFSADTTVQGAVFHTGYAVSPDGTVTLSSGAGVASIQNDTLHVRLDVGLLCGRYDLSAVPLR